MLNSRMRDMPVITIHISPADKEALKHKAEQERMQLATYCRIVLMNSLKSNT